MMTLYDVIHALESAHSAVETSLNMVRSLVGSVPPLQEHDTHTEEVIDTHQAIAADIMKVARKSKPRGLSAKRRERIRKSGVSREVRSRAAKQSWAARRAKKTAAAEPTEGPTNFGDYATAVLKAAGRPMDVEELATEMSKLGWTTSSANVVGLFGVMMPQVKGVRKTAPRTWEYKNNGK